MQAWFIVPITSDTGQLLQEWARIHGVRPWPPMGLVFRFGREDTELLLTVDHCVQDADGDESLRVHMRPLVSSLHTQALLRSNGFMPAGITQASP